MRGSFFTFFWSQKCLKLYVLASTLSGVFYATGLFHTRYNIWPIAQASGSGIVGIWWIVKNKHLRTWPFVGLASAVFLFAASDVLRFASGRLVPKLALGFTVASLFTIAGYTLLSTVLLGFAYTRLNKISHILNSLLDASMAATSLLGIIWVYVVDPAFSAPHTPVSLRLSVVIYPSLALVAIILTLRIPFSQGDIRPLSYWLILVATSVAFVGEVLRLLISVHVNMFFTPVLVLARALVFMLLTCALMHRSVRILSHKVGSRSNKVATSQLLLVVLALATPAILVYGERSKSIEESFLLSGIDLVLAVAATLRIVRVFQSQQRSERELAHRADHDDLTGLVNRRGVLDNISLAVEASSQLDHIISLLYIDLDHFKEVNDTYGHAAGDQLLIAIGARLKSIVRRGDLVARLGGDEFLVVVNDVQGAGEAHNIASEIRSSLDTTFNVDNKKIRVSASIGVASSIGFGGDDPDYLLRCADAAMYRAKAAGRDTVISFDPKIADEGTWNQGIAQDLEDAVSNNEFFLVYQPILRASDSRVEGVEALLRWKHPSFGVMYPSTFIVQALDTDMGSRVELWVLDQAIRTRAELSANGTVSDSFYVSVNVSFKLFEQRDLVSNLASLLALHGVAGSMLCLEIQQGSDLDQATIALDVFAKLHELGIKIALDGSASTSKLLSQMRSLPVDTIKIGISPSRNSNCGSEHEIDLVSVCFEAKRLHLETVAKKIETKDQASFLGTIGCDLVQGFFWSKPVRAEYLHQSLHTITKRKQSAPTAVSLQ